MTKIKKIIFLTGHRKSGTTLLHRLFDNHHGIDVYPDDLGYFYAYFPYYTEKYKNNKEKLINRIVKIFLTLSRFDSYNKNYNKKNVKESISRLEKSLLKINLLSKKQVFFTIVREWYNLTNNENKGILLVKETSQSMFFKEFKEYFPNFHMVNLIRDPRDNYASIKSGIKNYYSKMGEDEISSLTSTIFRARQDLISAKINKKNNSYLNIKYENLVTKPRATMKRLTEFLQIDYDSCLIEPTILGTPYKGNNFSKLLKGIDEGNINNWRKRISKDECCVIEYFMHDVMNEWGYKLEYSLEFSERIFSKFYEKMNSKYFYKNSF